MRSDPSLSTPAADDIPKEPLLRWAGINALRLTIYLALASLGTAAALVLPNGASDTWEEVAATAGYAFLVGGLLGIPGTVLWLLWVSQMPPEWSARDRRVYAALASPLIQVVLLGAFLSSGAHALALVFGLLLPAGSSLVVRLRERRPSSNWPQEDQ